MKTNTSDLVADLAAVLKCVAKGGVKEHELLARIHARSEKIRQRILHEHGVLEVAVKLIRECREE